MASGTAEVKFHLSGDWTITGIVAQFESLSRYLNKLLSRGMKRIDIDCGCIDSIDFSGLQLLHVWLDLVKLHGVKASLVNLSKIMQHTIDQLKLGNCFPERAAS